MMQSNSQINDKYLNHGLGDGLEAVALLEVLHQLHASLPIKYLDLVLPLLTPAPCQPAHYKWLHPHVIRCLDIVLALLTKDRFH